MELLLKILICFLAGAGAGIGTGFAGMSAAAVIGPMLVAFLGVPAYEAVGIGLISDVLASAVSAYTYKLFNFIHIFSSISPLSHKINIVIFSFSRCVHRCLCIPNCTVSDALVVSPDAKVCQYFLSKV